MQRKKIFIFPVPAIGHSNPIFKTANELIKNYNADVVIYSLDMFKQYIESIGAEFRAYNDQKYEDMMKEMNFNNDIVSMWHSLIVKNYDLVDKTSMNIAKDIDRDKPDLVLQDSLSVNAKFAMRILRENYKRAKEIKNSTDPNLFVPSSEPPPTLVYWTTFTNDENLYPNEFEKKIALNISYFDTFRFFLVNFKFNRLANNCAKKYQLPYKRAIDDVILRDPTENHMVFTFPVLHPRAHLFDKKTSFVGSCIDDDVHINGVVKYNDEKINKLLNDFSVISEKQKIIEGQKKLIYISIGTVFSENNRLFTIIIEAFNKFDELSLKNNEKPKAKLNELQILISMGSSNFHTFNELIKNDKLKVADNIILAPSVPQLEILKRASLFITHSGMNSTSESIHFAVPQICLPLNGDQPLNAYRVATELGLGLCLDYKNLTKNDIVTAVNTIFEDISYYERCLLYSNLSRKYIGHKNACKKIFELIS